MLIKFNVYHRTPYGMYVSVCNVTHFTFRVYARARECVCVGLCLSSYKLSYTNWFISVFLRILNSTLKFYFVLLNIGNMVASMMQIKYIFFYFIFFWINFHQRNPLEWQRSILSPNPFLFYFYCSKTLIKYESCSIHIFFFFSASCFSIKIYLFFIICNFVLARATFNAQCISFFGSQKWKSNLCFSMFQILYLHVFRVFRVCVCVHVQWANYAKFRLNEPKNATNVAVKKNLIIHRMLERDGKKIKWLNGWKRK